MKLIVLATLLVFAICVNARTLTKRDTKSEILAEVDEYEKKGKIEIEKLIKDNQKTAADKLQKQLDELLAVAKEFKTATGPEAVKLLTDKITKLLGAFKATVNVLTDQTNTKDKVIENAEKLLSNAEEEVQKLLSAGRLIPGDLLKGQANKLKDRIEALKKASDNLAIKTLEIDINLLMVRINADLRLLGFVASTPVTTEAIIASSGSTKAATSASIVTATAGKTVPSAPKAGTDDEPTTVPPTVTTFMCNTHPE